MKEAYFMEDFVDFEVCIDSEVKEQAEALYNDLGLTLSTAVNIFMRQSLRVGGFPFELGQKYSIKDSSTVIPGKECGDSCE